MELVFKEESFAIMGACFEVYKEMGCGSVEPVYQECLALELAMQDIPSLPEEVLALPWLGNGPRVDLVLIGCGRVVRVQVTVQRTRELGDGVYG